MHADSVSPGWRGIFLDCVLLIGLILTNPQIHAASPSPETVTLQLSWQHRFQFAGYYAAIEKGFYRDAGLDVHLVEAGAGHDDIVKEVTDGHAQYGIGNSSLLLARAQGMPVVALAVILQHSPYALIARESYPGQLIRDLNGKRVMLDALSGEILALLSREGLKKPDINILPSSYDPQALLDGKVDAMSFNIVDDPWYFGNAGLKRQIYSPRSQGMDFYGDTLFTSEREMNEFPRRVRDFREASLKGWRYALEHPDEIIELIRSKWSPKLSQGFLKQEATQYNHLIERDLTELGQMNPERWQHIASIFANEGMIPQGTSIDGFLYDPNPYKIPVWVWHTILTALAFLLVASALLYYIYRLNQQLKKQFVQCAIAEESAHLSEKRYRAIADYTYSWENWVDLNGKLVWVNPAVERISGYTPEECYAMREYPLELIHPDDKERLAEEFARAVQAKAGESGKDIEFRLIHKSGRVRWCAVSWQNVVDPSGIPIGHRSGVRDITERKNMMAALFDARQMLQLVLDHIPQRIFWKDRDGKYLGVNMAYARAFGLTDPNLILGRTAFDFHTLEHAKAVRKDDIAIMESGQSLIDQEDAIQQFDGSMRWEVRSKVPLKDGGGNIVGILGIYEDITQFKQAEMAARENELRLRLALSASKQALYEINLVTNIITFSQEITTIAEDKAVAATLPISRLFEKFHPNDREQMGEVFRAYLAGELPVFRCEGRLETENSEWKWVLLLGAIVDRDSQGCPTKMLGTVTDTSDIKRLADQVQENVQRLRDITDTLAEGLLVQDANGCITFVNPEAKAILGWDENELIGCNAHERIHSRQVDGALLTTDQCHIQSAIKSGKSFIGETLFQRKDGSMIPVSVSVAPFRKNSRISESVIAFRCIDEQLKTQQKLKETLRELNIILNSAQAGIGLVKDRKFIWVNKQMMKMFGYHAKEIQSKSTRMVYPDDETYETVGYQAYPLLAQGKTFEQECRLQRKNGETFWCQLRGSAIDPGNLVKGSIWIIVNIDRLKKTEQGFQELNQELEKRVFEETRKNIEQERILTHQARHAAMGEMIGNIAHQWRQPLNTLGLVIQNIVLDYQEGTLNGKTLAEYKETAINTVQKMSQTIDDFRNFFQPNRLEETFSLLKPIQEALSLILASMKNNNVSVTVDCPTDLVAFGLPNEFAQVILNLLANAKDALVEKNIPLKKIEISAHAENNRAVICVRDNGGGIPADIIERIFDPYFTSKESGTGIGLYMTRVIVEQHMHGKITCRNTQSGAEFILVIPLEKNQS